MPKIKYISLPSYISGSLKWYRPSIFPKKIMTRPLFVELFIDLTNFVLSDATEELFLSGHASEAACHATEGQHDPPRYPCFINQSLTWLIL